MAKKKDTSVPLAGITTSVGEGKFPLGYSRDSKQNSFTEPAGNLSDKQFYGYHSTGGDRASIAKSGLKTSTPGAGYTTEQAPGGVYYSQEPQVTYGKDLYRLTIDSSRHHSDNNAYDGDALSRSISAKNVELIGHRGNDERVHFGDSNNCSICGDHARIQGWGK